MEKLRVGVVGVGYLGRFHALIYSRHPAVELVGVADTLAETAQSVAALAANSMRAPWSTRVTLGGEEKATSLAFAPWPTANRVSTPMI